MNETDKSVERPDLEGLRASGFTPGPWYVADGSSWRRIRSDWRSGQHVEVITPTKQNDGHPDLSCARGHDRMANLGLAAAAPALLDYCEHLEARLAEAEARVRELEEAGNKILAAACDGEVIDAGAEWNTLLSQEQSDG